MLCSGALYWKEVASAGLLPPTEGEWQIYSYSHKNLSGAYYVADSLLGVTEVEEKLKKSLHSKEIHWVGRYR